MDEYRRYCSVQVRKGYTRQDSIKTAHCASHSELSTSSTSESLKKGSALDPLKWSWQQGANGLQPVVTILQPAPLEVLKLFSCRCKKLCDAACSCHRAGLVCSMFEYWCCSGVEWYWLQHQQSRSCIEVIVNVFLVCLFFSFFSYREMFRYCQYQYLLEIKCKKCHNWRVLFQNAISKNTKMDLTLNSYIKFNVESVPSVHSSQNSFLPLPKWVWILQSGSKCKISRQISVRTQ